MGQLTALPALSIRPPESPLDAYSKAVSLRALLDQATYNREMHPLALEQQRQENQARGMQVQQTQQQMQDSKTINDYFAQNPGRTFADAANDLRGKISFPGLQGLAEANLKMSDHYKKQTDTELQINDRQLKAYTGIYDYAQKLPDDQYVAQWPNIAQAIQQVPGNKMKVDPAKPVPKNELGQFGPMLQIMQGYQDREVERRTKAAGAQKAEAENKWYAENNLTPGVPLEVQEANTWLKNNPGKSLVDYQRYKATLVPQFNFNLQQGGGVNAAPLNPKQQATVQAILDGRMSPPSSFALRTPYWQNIMGAVFETDPQFSEQRAQLRKNYTVPQGNNAATQINAINTAMGHVGVLGDAIDALDNGNLKQLNRVANALGVQVGKDPVTVFNTIVHRVGPELTRAYVGSAAGEGERQLTEKDFDPTLGPQQLRSNVQMTARLLRSKISSLENQWNQNAAAGQDFQSRFIMPEAQRQLNKWAPQAGGWQSNAGQGQQSATDPFAQFGGRKRD